MKEFDEIFLSWRKGQGAGRHIVGVFKTIRRWPICIFIQ